MLDWFLTQAMTFLHVALWLLGDTRTPLPTQEEWGVMACHLTIVGVLTVLCERWATWRSRKRTRRALVLIGMLSLCLGQTVWAADRCDDVVFDEAGVLGTAQPALEQATLALTRL